jgi:hypothetical protein
MAKECPAICAADHICDEWGFSEIWGRKLASIRFLFSIREFVPRGSVTWAATLVTMKSATKHSIRIAIFVTSITVGREAPSYT